MSQTFFAWAVTLAKPRMQTAQAIRSVFIVILHGVPTVRSLVQLAANVAFALVPLTSVLNEIRPGLPLAALSDSFFGITAAWPGTLGMPPLP